MTILYDWVYYLVILMFKHMKKLVVFLIALTFLIPSISQAAFERNLKYGMRGEDVRELQEFLTEQGAYSGPITGNFYSLTLKAVKAFQTRESISPASGYWGPMTRNKANQILSEQLKEHDLELPSLAEQLQNPDLLNINDPAPSFSPLPQQMDFSNPWTNPNTGKPEGKTEDVCENIVGIQKFVPLGYTWETDNFCREFKPDTTTTPASPVQASPTPIPTPAPVQTTPLPVEQPINAPKNELTIVYGGLRNDTGKEVAITGVSVYFHNAKQMLIEITNPRNNNDSLRATIFGNGQQNQKYSYNFQEPIIIKPNETFQSVPNMVKIYGLNNDVWFWKLQVSINGTIIEQ